MSCVKRGIIGWAMTIACSAVALVACSAAQPDEAEPVALKAAAPVARADVSRTDDATPQLQAGVNGFARYNIENPVLNFFHVVPAEWRQDSPDGYPISHDLIDVETGFPRSLPEGSSASTLWFFGGQDDDPGGEWVLEIADGAGRINVVDADYVDRKSDARVEFTRKTKDDRALAIYMVLERIDGPIRDIRLYKKKNEELINAGQVFDPAYLDAVDDYHIVRTMNLQGMNVTFITSDDEIPDRNFLFWGEGKTTPGKYQSAPVDVLFELSMRTGADLWMQTPPQLGFPYSWDSHEVLGNREKVAALAQENARAAVDSEEWDHFADRVVAALIASGYPVDRPFYISVGNEIWNFGAGFSTASKYAEGIGIGITGRKRGLSVRDGYGALLARMMMAMDDALARADRTQNITYVLESKTGTPLATRNAFDIAKSEIKRADREWQDFAPRVGVAITTYWGNRTFDRFARQRNGNVELRAIPTSLPVTFQTGCSMSATKRFSPLGGYWKTGANMRRSLNRMARSCSGPMKAAPMPAGHPG